MRIVKFNSLVELSIATGATLLMFVVVYAVWGFHYEILDDSYRIAFMQSLYYEKPIDDFFIYYIGISQVLALLYSHMPQIEWYSLFTLVTLCISLSTILYVLLKWFKNLFGSAVLNVGLPLLLYVLFAIYYMVAWHWTKTASVCTIAALMLCFYHYRNKASVYWVVCICVLMLLGLCIRYQNVLVLLVIGSMYTVIVHGSLRPLLFPIAITLFFIVSLTLKDSLFASEDVRLLNRIEPYVFSHLDAGSVKCNQPDNIPPGDQMKIVAFEDWFFTDFEMITPKFLETYYTTNILSKCSVASILNKLHWQWQDYGEYLVKSIGNLLLLSVIALMVACYFAPGMSWLRPVVFNLLFIAMMLAIAVIIKLEKRHLTPFVTLACFCNIHIATINCRKNICSKFFKRSYLLLPVLVGMFIPAIFYANDFACFKREEEIFCRELRKEVEDNFHNKKVAMDVWACMAIANAGPFEIPKFNKNRNLLIYDSGYGMFYKTAREEIETKTVSRGFKGYMDYLHKEKSKVVFIQADSRSMLFSSYMEAVYNTTFVFKELKEGSKVKESAKYCARKNISYYVIN